MSQFVKFDKLKQVLQGLLDISTKRVLVGIPDGTTGRTDDDQGPMNNATLGYIHENGSPAANIPARPHLIPGVEDAADEIAERLKKAWQAALDGKKDKVRQQLEAAGLVAQNSVKNKINDGDFAPLSPVTLQLRYWAKEGVEITGKTVGYAAHLVKNGLENHPGVSDKPLVVTGQYRNSITYVVRSK